MSFLYRDGLIVPRMHFNRNTAAYETFKKYWSTTTKIGVDGKPIEVYVPYMHFYVNGFISDTVTKKFVKAIGMSWEELTSQDVDSEIETMSFILRDGFEWDGSHANSDITSTPVGSKDPPDTFIIADMLNSSIPLGEEFTATVSYGGSLKRYINEHELSWIATGTSIESGPLDTDTIREVLHSNPWYYLANSRHIQYDKNSNPFYVYSGNVNTNTSTSSYVPRNSALCDVATSSSSPYGIFALLGDDLSFTVSRDTAGNAIASEEKVTTNSTVGNNEIVRYVYSYTYVFNGVTPSSPIVKEIYDWIQNYYPDGKGNGIELNPRDKINETKVTATIDTKFKNAILGMYSNTLLNGSSTVEDSLYLYDYDWMGEQTTYLKVDSCAVMKRSDFVKMLSKSIDTDYTVEDKDWWEDLVMFVLIIIVIVVSYFTAGLATGASVSAIAAFASYAAIGFTLSGMLLTQTGGLSSAGNVKILGSFATVFGYIAMITGIYSLIQNATKKLAAQALADAVKNSAPVVNASVTDIAIQIAKDVFQGITSVFTEGMSASANQVVNATSEVLQIATVPLKYYEDQEKKELDSLQDEYDELQDAYNESILNRSVFYGSTAYTMVEKKLMTPDMITDIDETIKTNVMGTPSYIAWSTSVSL